MSELSAADDERLVKLETLIAFHEETLRELSDVLHQQQQTIDALVRRLNHAESRLKDAELEDRPDPADEPPPPHY
jgi:SlyX protein